MQRPKGRIKMVFITLRLGAGIKQFRAVNYCRTLGQTPPSALEAKHSDIAAYRHILRLIIIGPSPWVLFMSKSA